MSYFSYESTYRAAKIAIGKGQLYLFDYNFPYIYEEESNTEKIAGRHANTYMY
jgi:hypothetical protein